MRKILLAIIPLILFVSCVGAKDSVIKKEKINIYEVKDTFGELKKSETPMMVIIRECNEIGNIIKVGFYEPGGKLMISETFTYNENGEVIKSSKQTGDYAFLSITEDIYREEGRWFKEENGVKTLLGVDYKIAGYKYTDYIQEKVNGTHLFYEPNMGIEFIGTINKTDNSGRWITFTATTQSVETPQIILEREFEIW